VAAVDHLREFRVAHGCEAEAYGLPIDLASTRAAKSDAATEPRSRQPQIVAQLSKQLHFKYAAKRFVRSIHFSVGSAVLLASNACNSSPSGRTRLLAGANSDPLLIRGIQMSLLFHL
jgi:hypothetical protein